MAFIYIVSTVETLELVGTFALIGTLYVTASCFPVCGVTNRRVSNTLVDIDRTIVTLKSTLALTGIVSVIRVINTLPVILARVFRKAKSNSFSAILTTITFCTITLVTCQ